MALPKAFPVLLVLLVACERDRARPPPAPRVAEAVAPVDAGSTLVKDAFTPKKLDAFVRYQEQMIQVFADATREVARLEGRKQADGGTKGGALAIFEAKARAEEELRQKAGLTEREVEALEEVVWGVMSKRTAARALGLDGTVAQLERMIESASPEHKPALEQALERMRGQRDALNRLDEERKRFGDAAVDLVLSREEALSRNWEAMMKQPADRRR